MRPERLAYSVRAIAPMATVKYLLDLQLKCQDIGILVFSPVIVGSSWYA